MDGRSLSRREILRTLGASTLLPTAALTTAQDQAQCLLAAELSIEAQRTAKRVSMQRSATALAAS